MSDRFCRPLCEIVENIFVSYLWTASVIFVYQGMISSLSAIDIRGYAMEWGETLDGSMEMRPTPDLARAS